MLFLATARHKIWSATKDRRPVYRDVSGDHCSGVSVAPRLKHSRLVDDKNHWEMLLQTPHKCRHTQLEYSRHFVYGGRLATSFPVGDEAAPPAVQSEKLVTVRGSSKRSFSACAYSKITCIFKVYTVECGKFNSPFKSTCHYLCQ